MYTKKQLAQLVIDACEYYSVDNVVISPGSRNAPLTIGFSKHSKIKAFSVVDERCAAFFAMGIAQQTLKPVALVCTSGSALLNYYPAIAEAYYSKIPLIIISADRPQHLIDIGDGQTIRQENVFSNHILYSANLIEEDKKLAYNSEQVVKAIQYAIEFKGPVHINVPFEEPLYELQLEKQEFNFLNNKNTLITLQESEEIDYAELLSQWNGAAKKMILVGVNYPNSELEQFLENLVDSDGSVLVLTETTSNLNHPKFINSIDQLITKFTSTDFKKFQPDLLITFGGFVVSKRIKQFLRNYKPDKHWHIDPYTKLDTYFCLSSFIKKQPLSFFKELLQGQEYNNEQGFGLSYQKIFLQEKQNRKQKHQEFLAQAAYSDFKVLAQVLETLPDNVQLQLGNSSVVRYAQLFDINKELRIFCNRGTSGIDGSTSTAIGASVFSNIPTVFVTGDISFFYDSNALWNNYVPNDFRIILINNDGGGIFKIIPGPKKSKALSFFETKHGLTAQYLAITYGYGYSSAKSLIEVKEELSNFYKPSEKPKILEIFTPSEINDVVLYEYFNFL